MNEPVERLRRLDSCAVSDACDQLGLGGRVSTAARSLTGRHRIAGRATTVELGPPSGSPSTRHLCAAAIEAAGPDDIIVIAHQGRSDCAGWGGNLSRVATRRSVAGTIIDGATRDVDEATDLGYAVFAIAATPRTARGRTEEKSWGQPITFDGVTVGPGDFVIGDSTGIVFIPADRIDDVLDAAERIAATEASMAEAIDGGRPIGAVMGVDYESMLD